jgi:uncharacterized membrane protein (DUF4010 family)
VLIEVLVVNASLLPRVLVPFTAMAAVAGVAAWLYFRRGHLARSDGPAVDAVAVKNPFSLTEAAKFAAFFAVVLVLVKGVQIYFPGEGLYVVAALAGLTDVDAITLSMAEYAKAGDAAVAVDAIVIAALTNTVVKIGMVVMLGSRELRRPVLLAGVGLLVAGGGTLLLV